EREGFLAAPDGSVVLLTGGHLLRGAQRRQVEAGAVGLRAPAVAKGRAAFGNAVAVRVERAEPVEGAHDRGIRRSGECCISGGATVARDLQDVAAGDIGPGDRGAGEARAAVLVVQPSARPGERAARQLEASEGGELAAIESGKHRRDERL